MKLAWIFGFPPQQFLIAQMNFSLNENENKFKNYEFKDTFFHCAFFCTPAGNHQVICCYCFSEDPSRWEVLLFYIRRGCRKPEIGKWRQPCDLPKLNTRGTWSTSREHWSSFASWLQWELRYLYRDTTENLVPDPQNFLMLIFSIVGASIQQVRQLPSPHLGNDGHFRSTTEKWHTVCVAGMQIKRFGEFRSRESLFLLSPRSSCFLLLENHVVVLRLVRALTNCKN